MSTEAGFWGRLKSVGLDDLQQLLDDHVSEGTLLEFKRFSVPATGVFDIQDLAGVLCGMANTAGGRVILGHSTILMTMRYNHLAPEQHRTFVDLGIGSQPVATRDGSKRGKTDVRYQ